MPQAKRKTPFSGKAKKQQIQNKKHSKFTTGSGQTTFLVGSSDRGASYEAAIRSLNSQPGGGGRASNRYALKFQKETEEELMRKKEDSLRGLNPVDEKDLEVDGATFFPEDLAFPVRPPWNFEMSREKLDMQEQKYFTEYVRKVEQTHTWDNLSYFELNLETWRQLWRVLEISDILLVIVDIRFPPLMFPPSLFKYVCRELGKDMILVLNKIDLVPAPIVASWRAYFEQRYPGIKVIYFTSCPAYNLRGNQSDKAGLLLRQRKGRLRMCAEGAMKLLETCKELVHGEVDLSSWEHKIKEENKLDYEDGSEEVVIGETINEKPDTKYEQHEKFKNGILTIGCIGQPNVGKSSMMNALMGKKVVSVSKTPGHTKHFQTIFLTETVRLCDSPGLVFPSKVPRTLQILMGSFPIAQLREPFTTIRYIAEHMDLPKLLRIEHPENDTEWSPRDVCDGWAKKRGFYTAKAARLDSHRAANAILRMALDGKICLCLRPPGYYAEKEKWEKCEEIHYIKWVQALTETENQDPYDAEALLADLSDSDDLQNDDSNESDDDESSDSSDDELTARVANKFAALSNDE